MTGGVTGAPPPGTLPPDTLPPGTGAHPALAAVLSESRELGFLGPGPVETQIERALQMLPLLAGSTSISLALDLGSGGGIPGLPLALACPGTRWVLLDGSPKRTRFLVAATARLGLEARVSVLTARAEEAGRDGGLRAGFDLVVARSFGPPAVTAECASPFLRVGGRLIVAEPPGGSPGRWSEDGLAGLGMRRGEALTSPSAFQVLEQVAICPDRYPRRVGIPAKRPLF